MTVEQTYNKLRKKHKILPHYNSINFEFEISTIEKTDFPLREIKKKISEALEPILDFLEHIINPDPNNLSDMFECRCYTSDEKKQLIDLYRHTMEQYRAILESNLENEENKDAELIRTIHDNYKKNKKTLLPHIKKLREFWHKHIEQKEILRYVG